MRSRLTTRLSAIAAAVLVAYFAISGLPPQAAHASTSAPATQAPATNPSLQTMNAKGNHTLGSTISLDSRSAASSPQLRQSATPAASTLKGQDVSSYQPNVNWTAQWNAGSRFAYVKATEGNYYASSVFAQQYGGSYNVGMVRGSYHFARPDQSTGSVQANWYLSHGGGWKNDGRTLPPLLDIEYNPVSGGNSCYGKTPSAMVNWIADYSNAILFSTGRRPAIYTTTNWWARCTGNTLNFAKNPLFIANWTGTPTPLPAAWTSWDIWQNGHTGTFSGDEDVFNGDLIALTAFASESDVGVARISGIDRYAVSAGVSATFTSPVNVAYVASGEKYPDALSGAALAGRDHAPILLVKSTGIPSSIAAELTRLHPASIIVLGGTASVSAAVETKLRTYTTGSVTRIAGADRYAASANMSATFGAGVAVAYVSTGLNFPDALGGAALAASAAGGPILLVPGRKIPGAIANELRRLQPLSIVILGGTASVSSSVETQLQAFTAGQVSRIAGSDRYAVSAAISATAAPGIPVIYVATGQKFPDALSAAPAVGIAGGRILLVPGSYIPSSIRTELLRVRPARIIVLGGTSSVSAHVEALLHQYIYAP